MRRVRGGGEQRVVPGYGADHLVQSGAVEGDVPRSDNLVGKILGK